MTWLPYAIAAVLIAAVVATLIARRHRGRPPHVAPARPFRAPGRPVRWTGQIGPDLGLRPPPPSPLSPASFPTEITGPLHLAPCMAPLGAACTCIVGQQEERP